jgi:hypothetical protein
VSNKITFVIFLVCLLFISPLVEIATAEFNVPIIGAVIFAEGPEGSGSSTTGASGQYLIDVGLKTGIYKLGASAEGYITKYIPEISVQVGSEKGNTNFLLLLSGAVSGKVTDSSSGQLLKGVIITVTSKSGLGYLGITNSDGSYMVATNLDTGTYNVTAVRPSGYISNVVKGVSVTAGVETKNIDLALAKSGVITGRITSASGGNPLFNVTVLASSAGGAGTGTAQTDVNGNYRIDSGLGTGTYSVTATSGLNVNSVPNVSVTAEQATSNINITLTSTPPQPSGTIKGKVTDSKNSGLIGVRVYASGPGGSGSGITDGEGNYVISAGLGSGSYTLSASKQGFIKNDKAGVSVAVGVTTSGIDFKLQSAPPEQSGKISGTVRGESNPLIRVRSMISCGVDKTTVKAGESVTVTGVVSPAVSGASVTLTFKKDATSIPVTAKSGSDGRYSTIYSPTSAGSWSVASSWSGNSAYLPSLSQPATFTVNEAPATGTLIITVKDPSGAAATGAQVSSTNQPSGQPALSGITSASGSITFNDVKPGSYNVQAAKTGYVSASGAVTAIASGTASLTLNLQILIPTTGSIKLIVRDSGGAPISGVNVLSTAQPNDQPSLIGTTDASGTITFNGVKSGAYTLLASKTGFSYVNGSGTVVAGNDLVINAFLQTQAPSSGGGIPGFPTEASILGILLIAIALIVSRNSNLHHF